MNLRDHPIYQSPYADGIASRTQQRHRDGASAVTGPQCNASNGSFGHSSRGAVAAVAPASPCSAFLQTRGVELDTTVGACCCECNQRHKASEVCMHRGGRGWAWLWAELGCGCGLGFGSRHKVVVTVMAGAALSQVVLGLLKKNQAVLGRHSLSEKSSNAPDSTSRNDYTSTCLRCGKRFVARFSVNDGVSQVKWCEFLSHATLCKEVRLPTLVTALALKTTVASPSLDVTLQPCLLCASRSSD